MQFTEIETPGIKARLSAWYDRNIVKGYYKSWSFIANAIGVVLGVLPDLINLLLDNWGMVDALPVLEAKHKLVLFGSLHAIALVVRVIKQKNMPVATIPVATVNVPDTLDVSTNTGRTIPVQTEIHVVESAKSEMEIERFVPAPDSRMFTFEDVVAYGRTHAPSLVDGVPWAFTFEGHAVTHERDDLYLIADLHTTHRLARGSVLWISPAGFLNVTATPL